MNDVIYGNEIENRKPIHDFINEVNKYDGLLNIMMSIEGMINKRSSHASGVILYNETPFETSAIMRTPSGELVTQFSLHDAEKMGDVKFDFLVTEISDKIIECIKFLQEDNQIDSSLSLREAYNKYLHPEVLDLTDKRIWDALATGEVMSVFQFDSPVGFTAAKTIKPTDIHQMTAANAMMRLMPEKGQESAMDKYVRFKNNPALWRQEMINYGLTQKEMDAVSKYYKKDFGVPPYQESLMLSLMDPDICGFSLKESNAARKIVAKKALSEIPKLKDKVFTQAKSQNVGKYIWDTCVAPQLGYSFSELHSLAYSFVAVQVLYLATNFHSIYWNTSCLVVNAGINEVEEIVEDFDSTETVENSNSDRDIEENEDENDEIKVKVKKRSTDYAKLATAMGKTIASGTTISKPNINISSLTFRPDVENNQILFGLSCISNIGSDLINSIIAARPYSSIEDLSSKVKVNKRAMLNLIKGGAFDSVYEHLTREEILASYIHTTAEEKKKLNLQNFNGLINANLVPEDLEFVVRVYQYTKVLKKYFKKDLVFILNNPQILQFYEDNFDSKWLATVDNEYVIDQKIYDKQIYQPTMDKARAWLKQNHDKVLKDYNNLLFEGEWKKYCKGNISSWEMDSISFYYHEHELANVNLQKYGLSDFNTLPEEPEVDYFFKKGGAQIPIFKLCKIVGTVISKNKAKATINILTTSGVATVKFRKEMFAIFDKQKAEKQEDGTKKITEKSWFTKGNKVMITGYRRDDNFVPKVYQSTDSHTLYKIDEVLPNGDLLLRSER